MTWKRPWLLAALAFAVLAAPLGAAAKPLDAEAPANPFAGARLFVDPESSAMRQVREWQAARPGDAALLERIASRSHADWFGAWSGNVRAAVRARVSEIERAGALPVLVAYNVPRLDCGTGGAPSASAYRTWIRSFARGIGSRRAVVILEPDSLALLDCLPAGTRASRLALLSAAVRVLVGLPRVAVYVDAGHSRWQPAAVMARRLAAVGVRRTRGFALNVSNFGRTEDELAYAEAVAARLGGRVHAVVDTSRNGLGAPPDGAWCNPPGRALGAPPTSATGHARADAFLWIKPPGESDGTCEGGPPAGTWWPEYALGLAQRAQP